MYIGVNIGRWMEVVIYVHVCRPPLCSPLCVYSETAYICLDCLVCPA